MALGGMEYGILFALCCSCLLVLGLGGAGIWYFTRDRNKSKGVIDVAARPAPAPAPAARPPQPPSAASARPAPPPAAESAPTVVYSRKDVEQAGAPSGKPATAADLQATMLHIPRVQTDAPKAEPPAAEPPSEGAVRVVKPAADPGATLLHLPSLEEPLEAKTPAAAEEVEQAGAALSAAATEGEAKLEAVADAGQAAIEAVAEEQAQPAADAGQAVGDAAQAASDSVAGQAAEAKAALDEIAASRAPAADDYKTILHVPPVAPPAAAEPPVGTNPLEAELSEAPTLRWPREDEPASAVSAASPNRAPDIREKLLGLNGPDKPYVVQESGFRITIAPTAITGYLLEISFDYITGTARLVETGPSDGGRIKADARQVLEANGWLAK